MKDNNEVFHDRKLYGKKFKIIICHWKMVVKLGKTYDILYTPLYKKLL